MNAEDVALLPREAIQEDEQGSLQAAIDEIGQKNRRKRYDAPNKTLESLTEKAFQDEGKKVEYSTGNGNECLTWFFYFMALVFR